MPNSYYNHTNGKPANATRGLASEVRDELDKIDAAFSKLPIPAAISGGYSNYGADTGLANAYVLAVNAAVVAYVDGQTLSFRAINANTGAATVNVNTLGLKALVRPDGSALQANDIYAGQIVQIAYNATAGNFQLQLTAMAAATAAAASAGTASAAAGAASGSAGSAATSANSAADSATLAQKWAVQLTLVDATYYGARKYSIDASGFADAAAASATTAQNSVAVLWNNSTVFATLATVISPITLQNYRRTAASPGASATDPSLDTTRYTALGGTGGLSVVVVTGTTVTALASQHLVLTNVASTAATLPATPGAGDTVWVTVANGLTTNTIVRNGNNIMGVAQDLTVNRKYATVYLRYINSTIGWQLV